MKKKYLKYNKSILLITCFLLLFVNFRASASSQESLLRISEPVDSVIVDLKNYIPQRMTAAQVPGLAIALIRDFKVVWTEGFGVTNQITKRPVESRTVFEVASISKPVTAYIALRLIDQGLLSLDKPVRQYLKDPWLPPSEYANLIAIRHLLSHSSGLGDDIFFMNKDISFEPGSEFFYSGVGFLYLQEIVEHITQKSLEELADELVFLPNDMKNSSFTNKRGVRKHMANGHMKYIYLLLAFLIPFCVVFFVVIMISKIVCRVAKGTWKLPRLLIIGLFILSYLLIIILHFLTIGPIFLNLAGTSAICALIFIAFLQVCYFFFNLLLLRFKVLTEKRNLRTVLATVLMIIIFALLLKITEGINGPVFKNHSTSISSNGTLRSSAPDLAAFLIELTKPRFLEETIAAQIDSVQIYINANFSWGLGMGIQHSASGDALWQNAISFAFRSVIVLYPDTGLGVVVLTNSASGLPVAYDVAGRALGGKAAWGLF